jgi:hypothetical protein
LAEEVNRVLDQLSIHTSETVTNRLLPELRLMMADLREENRETAVQLTERIHTSELATADRLDSRIGSLRMEVMAELRDRFDRVDVGLGAVRLHTEDQVKGLHKELIETRVDLLKEFAKQVTGTVLVTVLVAMAGTIFIAFVL